MTLDEKILNLRKARGWSQEELAERIGVTRQAVSRWESGSAKPDADKIVTICDLFGVSADYLLRDLAGGVEASVSFGSPKKGQPWLAWAASAFGAVTLLILGILASANRTYVEPVYHISSDGRVHIQRSGYYTGLFDYLDKYGLDWLACLAGLSLLFGSGYLLFRWYQQLWKENIQE